MSIDILTNLISVLLAIAMVALILWLLGVEFQIEVRDQTERPKSRLSVSLAAKVDDAGVLVVAALDSDGREMKTFDVPDDLIRRAGWVRNHD